MSLQNWEKAKVKKSISPLCPGNQLTVRNPHRVWLTEDSMVRALVPGSVRQGLSNTNSFSINDYIINCLIQQEHNACQAAFVSVCLRSRIPSRGSASTELAKSPSVRSPQNRLASGIAPCGAKAVCVFCTLFFLAFCALLLLWWKPPPFEHHLPPPLPCNNLIQQSLFLPGFHLTEPLI